jgi:hypothetical protein
VTTTSPTDHDPIAEDPVLVDAGGSPTRRSRRSRRFGLLAALAAGVLFLAACEKPPYQMVFPVAGSSRFSNTFGAPRGPNFSHQGEDIFAPKGTPLIAVTDGTITHMRWGTGTRSGNLVQLTDDGGWFYYYIHLNNDSPGTDDGVNRYDQAFADGITIGQRVKAGEVIGYLGDAGDAENTAPHLHFEVHKPGTGAIDPNPALVEARRFVRSDAERIADSPTGTAEVFAFNADGTVLVTGFAFDAYRNDPIRVSAYVAGNLIATVTANGDRGDLASRGRGTRHGFVFPSVGARGGGPVPKGAEICVVAHSIGGGGSSRIGCSTAPK